MFATQPYQDEKIGAEDKDDAVYISSDDGGDSDSSEESDGGPLKVQCTLDIQTSLRHQGHGCYRQRGRFIKRLDIATWRPL